MNYRIHVWELSASEREAAPLFFLLSCPLISCVHVFCLVDSFSVSSLTLLHSKWWSLSNRKDMLLVSTALNCQVFAEMVRNPSRSKELVGESSRIFYWGRCSTEYTCSERAEEGGRGEGNSCLVAAQVWRALIRFPQALSLRLWQMFSNVTGRVTGRQ